MIHGKVVAEPTERVGVGAATAARLAVMERLVRASRAMADSLDPFEAAATLVKEVLLRMRTRA